MKLTPLQRRAERRDRHKSMVDMNLVSLIDVFTILIFFLLSNSVDVEILPSPAGVKLPESTAQTIPRETIVVAVNNADISVGGRRVAAVTDVMSSEGDLIAPLQAALEQQALALRSPQARADGSVPTATEPAVTIMGDQQIPYRLLRKVMATAARANFNDVSFAVRKRDAV